MRFSTFWLNNLFCVRNCVCRIEEKKKQIREKEKLKNLTILIFLYFEFILYAIPLLLELFLISATKQNKQGMAVRKICGILTVLICFHLSSIICAQILFPLIQLALLFVRIQYYVSDSHPLSSSVQQHVDQLFAERQHLYDTIWVTNLNTFIKILIILISLYVLLILIKVILDQVIHIIFDRK